MKTILKNADEAVIVLTKKEVEQLSGACSNAWLYVHGCNESPLVKDIMKSLFDELEFKLKAIYGVSE